MKYLGYCRKSTDEPDRQILSIEAQVAELKEFAAKEKLEIVDFILENKTAKEPGREKFAEVIRLLESGVANGIISWHPDRLARNSVDGGNIIYLLDTGKLLDLKFPSFWFDNTPQGKFMLNMAFGQSKYYVDSLSVNVKRGNRQKLRRGEWPNKAPFGYLNDMSTKTIQVDKKRAKFVRQAFEMYATGGYGQLDIINFFTKNKIFNRSGHIVHANKIKRILSDPFYYGVMKFGGELYEGGHKPLITKKLFDKVQEVVRRKSRTHESHVPEFDFLGLVKCGECGGSITAEKHVRFYPRTNRTVTFIYYRCSKKYGHCSQRYITGSEMEEKIRVVVKNVSISNYVAKKFLEWAEKDSNKERVLSEKGVSDLTRQLKEVEEKIDRLLEAYLDKVIEETEYKAKKNELLENKLSLQARIKEIKEKGNEWLEPFNEFVEKAKTGAKTARAKNNLHELAIHAKTVGSNFFLKDRQLTCEYVKQGYRPLADSAILASPRPSTHALLRGRDSNPDTILQRDVSYR
ncbi:MAG: Recombinase [Candidatus Woesebacteria bacterium GW2011_GWB1_39_12]|uniref:Recombinase n=1 Tax=Candidatus Woesebacteria bacterium GW2011_GWB1_39_12 TaxID=1618574 RepID=A0A0G0QB39_9BACT|nr:MAG: Recombinase [Candidatus Woesebacteria bacterium GW2011_GWB1_39_12]